jgi:phosphomannomutase
MKPEKVFKRYDVRGKYPEELNEEFVKRMGKSLGSFIQNNFGNKVVVCRDNKESSEALKENLVEGITSTGAEVVDVGVGPTDFAAFHGSQEETVSVQVTSSHMPLEFNGLKFMYPEGNGFLNEDLNQLKKIFKQENFTQGKGEVEEIEGRESYLESLADFARSHGECFDRKVVVDSLGGASRDFLPELMEKLGFEVVDLAEDQNGIYRNPPDPQPNLLEDLKDRVDSEGAYIGVATDLDGDRVQVYFDGEWVSGDDLFCVFAQVFDGKVVASVDTSKNLENFAEVEYTRVGDPFVVDRMITEEAVISGEANGHYCFSGFVNYNSGILAGALTASTDLEDKLQNIPDSFLEKKNIEYSSCEERDDAMQKFREKSVSQLEIESTVDGVLFSHKDASVLVRPSGSSPVIRIKSEAGSSEEAVAGLEAALDILGKN